MTIGFGQVKSAHAAANAASVQTSNATTATNGSGFLIVYQAQGSCLVSDSKNNTYVQIGTDQTYNFGGNRTAGIFYCANGNGGTLHTAKATYKSGSQDVSVYFQEMTTTNGNGIALDQSSATVSSTLATTPITTLVASELIFAIFCGASTSNPATHTVSGFSLAINANLDITNGASNLDCTGCIARRSVASIQTNLTGTFTEVGNSGGTMALFAASFYEVPGISVGSSALTLLGAGS